MRDTNLLLTDSAVAATAFAANALNLDGTPAEGVWVQAVITHVAAADATLDITVYGKDTDAAWATSDTPVGIVKQVVNADVAVGATIIRYLLVQTKLNFIKPRYVIAGTVPSWTVVFGVVSGPDQKQTAALA